MELFFNRLKASAVMTPDKPAIVTHDRYVTFGMLYSGVRSVQAAIASLKIKKNLPVGVLIDNPSQHLLVVLALLKSGYTVSSLRHDLLTAAREHNFGTLIVEGSIPLQTNCTVVSITDGWFTFVAAEQDETVLLPPERFVRIMFTSGTTGAPRPVAQTAQSLMNRLVSNYPAKAASYPRVLTTFGLSNAAWAISFAVLQNGNTIFFSPFDQVLDIIAMYRIDAISGSASQIEELVLRQSRSTRPVPLKLVQSGAGAMPATFHRRIREVFQAEPADTYFSSEGGEMGVAFGAAFARRDEGRNCFFPVGDVEIVDEDGTVLAPFAAGRIRTRSNSMAWPFDGALDLRSEQMGDGWFYPGDLGWLDTDGFLSVAGRSDEVVNDGGTKFAPAVLEQQLKALPEISDMAIFRTSVDDRQDVPAIAVVSDAAIDLQAINQWVQSNVDGELGGIRFYQLLCLDQIPRTEMGKVRRQELSDLASRAQHADQTSKSIAKRVPIRPISRRS